MSFRSEEHEKFLSSLILCDPITTKGMEDLKFLKDKGLRRDVTREYFYENDNLRVPSVYEENRLYEDVAASADEQTGIFHEYTFDREQFEKAKSHHSELMRRITSTTLNDPVFIFQGVTENGKSIEINRLIYQHTVNSETGSKDCSFSLLDFEEASSSVERGDKFEAWNDSTTAVSCVIIFEAIIKFVEKNLGTLGQTVCKYYLENVSDKGFGSEAVESIFKKIGEYTSDKPGKIREVFSAIKNVTSIGDAEKTILNLLQVLMWVMFCSNPNRPCRIIFDNIESRIVVDRHSVQIPDKDIEILHKTVKKAVSKMNLDIKNYFVTDVSFFSALFVVRRTTHGLLKRDSLHFATDLATKAEDLTGQFQLWEIWEKKRNVLWKGDLEAQLVDDEYKQLVAVMDIITSKGTNTLGRSYQALIASLMNYGLRRIGYAQAHASFMTCSYLLDSSSSAYTMGYRRFIDLMANADGAEWGATRYMARRALLEIQFKWSASQSTWKFLQIGYVSERCQCEKIPGLSGEIITRPLGLPTSNISMVSRILSFLSCHHSGYDNQSSFWENKTPDEMFDAVHLYDLIKEILTPSTCRRETFGYSIPSKDYRAFATVLIALSNMKADETQRSPYVILTVDDNEFHDSENAVETLTDILEQIISSGKADRKANGKFSCGRFNARITEAGFWFLHRWLHSFSYIAAISCYSIPPLFFLNDRNMIHYVLSTVYEKSKEICARYEKEAAAFLGIKDDGDNSAEKKKKEKNSKDGANDNALRFLHLRPSSKSDGEQTFRNLVKTQHKEHLDLYKDYITKSYLMLGLSEEDRDFIIGDIIEHIKKYRSEEWEAGKECF